jgi:hypothetical protein
VGRPASGIPARGYSWAPFEPGNGKGQRFEAGNELSTTHGVYSPRRIGPLAEAIEREARSSPNWPHYRDAPEYVPGGVISRGTRSGSLDRIVWLSNGDGVPPLPRADGCLHAILSLDSPTSRSVAVRE